MLVVGLMSGTSADAVEAALVEIDATGWRQTGRPRSIRLRGYHHEPYPAAVQQKLLELADPARSRVDELCRWNFALGEYFAAAVLALLRKVGIRPEQVAVIGSHGQTVHHLPEPETVGAWTVRSTLQIGEPAVIAERTGITTIANLRARDVAAGGQGAPLIAYLDALLYAGADGGDGQTPRRCRVLQNLGGIGNATCLPAHGGPETIFAFDTGPGNMVIDGVVAELSQGRLRYDEDGRWAARGRADKALVQQLLATDAFFAQPPPKTTGRERFGRSYGQRLIEQVRGRGGGAADIVATATWLTAASLADQYRRWVLPRLPGPIDEVWISGGGSQNPTLMKMIRAALAELTVPCSPGLPPRPAITAIYVEGEAGPQTATERWPASAKEAIGFAVLAAATWLGLPGNLPQVTGASRRVLLGEIVPGAGWPSQNVHEEV